MRKFLSILLGCLLFVVAAQAEPLPLGADLAGEAVRPLGDTENGPRYIYRYAYPQITGEDPSAALINQFYAYLVSDALDFEVPMMADYYAGIRPEADIQVQISYSVKCNNDDYFSVLLKTEGDDFLTFKGHTFSRKDLKPGSSVALPYLLGILATNESDTWLQERQTAKADDLVRTLIWEDLQARREELQIFPDVDRELFDVLFYPEEDFYLDETGNPVFYLEPGTVSDMKNGLLEFPISLWEIMDEM